MNKTKLRKICLSHQESFSEEELQQAGTQAAKKLAQWADNRFELLVEASTNLSQTQIEAPIVAAFASLPSEIQTDALIAHFQQMGCKVILPAIVSGELEFRLLQTPLDTLQKGAFGVRTPERSASVFSLVNATFIVVPGLAFDLKGGRLGFGKGYYDRALQKMHDECARQKKTSPATVALGLDSQLHAAIPMAAHDVFLSHLCTPQKGVFNAKI